MDRKPIIGITAHLELPGNKNVNEKATYSIRENYINCLGNDAIPIILPCDLSSVEVHSAMLDGLLITGGDFDIDPKLYGKTNNSLYNKLNPIRTEFEMALLKAFLKEGKPTLGICGGMQLINVFFGGTLIQHIPDEWKTNINHSQEEPKNQATHKVIVEQDSDLYEIIGRSSEFMVNSSHHQAVKQIGDNLRISAIAPDDIIEAIEHTSYRFCIGVQWHPEYLISKEDKLILNAFLEACRENDSF